MNVDYNFIRNWLLARHIVLEQSFVETIKGLAVAYKKKRNWQSGVLRHFGMFQTEFVLLGKSFLQHAA